MKLSSRHKSFFFHVVFLESKIEIKTLKHQWNFVYNAEWKKMLFLGKKSVRIKNESDEWAHFFAFLSKDNKWNFLNIRFAFDSIQF